MPLPVTPRITLIAHDHKKDTMVQLAQEFEPLLRRCALSATGTTGGRLVEEVGLTVERMVLAQLAHTTPSAAES